MPPRRDLEAFESRAAGYERGWLGRLHHDIADRTADLALSAVAGAAKHAPGTELPVCCRRPDSRR
jgi:hypothetical protein